MASLTDPCLLFDLLRISSSCRRIDLAGTPSLDVFHHTNQVTVRLRNFFISMPQARVDLYASRVASLVDSNSFATRAAAPGVRSTDDSGLVGSVMPDPQRSTEIYEGICHQRHDVLTFIKRAPPAHFALTRGVPTHPALFLQPSAVLHPGRPRQVAAQAHHRPSHHSCRASPSSSRARKTPRSAPRAYGR